MIKYETDRSSDVAKFDKSEPEPSTIENMIFVDFQYACWTSPAVDLHYFLNTSLHESLRPDRFDEFIVYYHGHLEIYLKRLGYKKSIPNLNQFKQQYHDKRFYGENEMNFNQTNLLSILFHLIIFFDRFYCILYYTSNIVL